MTPDVARSTIHSLRTVRFAQHAGDGVLTVFHEGADGVPFPTLRVFTVAGVAAGGRRGNHAHRACTQLLACLAGRVAVRIHDGAQETSVTLCDDGKALLIPPWLWNTVVFEGPDTVLAVFCDQLYDPDDYVRDWNEYLAVKCKR